MLERDVKFESKAGEDGKVKKKIIAGFFRDLWDTEKGLKTDDDKSEGDLEEEASEQDQENSQGDNANEESEEENNRTK